MDDERKEEANKQNPWEVSVKNGVLNCRIDLSGPDAITMALGVCDRIKSLVLNIEMKAQMDKKIAEMQKGIIVPGMVHPGANGKA